MSKYEALSRIGIEASDVRKITRYTLRQEGKTDVLKIYFSREKNIKDVFHPHSKKFHFGRAHKTVLVDSGRQIYEEVFEISPFVQQLVGELETIGVDCNQKMEAKERLIENLNHLEKVLNNKLVEIRKDIEALK